VPGQLWDERKLHRLLPQLDATGAITGKPDRDADLFHFSLHDGAD
jgi:hypothetical protein